MGKLLDSNNISACYVEAGIDATAGCADLKKIDLQKLFYKFVGLFNSKPIFPFQWIFRIIYDDKFTEIFNRTFDIR